MKYKTLIGDTLSKIAIKFYGDPNQYITIAQANPGIKIILGNFGPDELIKSGQVLNIPDILPKIQKNIATSENVVTLEIQGELLQFWTDINVSLEYDNIANTFSFQCPYEDFEPYKKLFSPFNDPGCAVYVNSQMVIAGVIKTINYKVTPNKSIVVLGGYSWSGILNNSSISPNSRPLQQNNTSFIDYVKRIIKPFGIDASYSGNVASQMKTKIKRKRVDPTTNIYSHITEHAQDIGVIIQSDNEGNLFFTSPDFNQEPVLSIGDEIPLATDFDITYNSDNLHSDYIGYLRYQKEEKYFGKYAQKLEFINQFRSKVTIGRDINKAQLEKMVKSEIGRAYSSAVQIKTRVPTWTNKNGLLIEPGQLVEVQYKNARIETPTLFFIRSVNFNNPPIECELELLPRGAFDGDILEFWS
jgi:prophage tail gpP-like protein/phage tail protein X